MLLPTKPDVPEYRRGAVPEHLWTYKQLKLAGLRPAKVSRPDGAWPKKHRDGHILWMWLYDVRQARAYVCTTKRGKHAANV